MQRKSDSGIKKGDKVFHIIFGCGIVEEAYSTACKVKFDSLETSRYIVTCKLRKI